jgi:sulfite exporter TauE/SafE
MLAFGLGTLPVMLAISFSAGSIRPFLQSKVLRQIIAVLLMVYGLYLLFSTAQNIR